MTVSVRLSPEEERRLHELAAATGRSKSFYVRAALRAHLDHLEMAFRGDIAISACVPAEQRPERTSVETSPWGRPQRWY